MKNYMKEYIANIDKYIVSDKDKDLDVVIREHLIKINFFMHERLIHLLVTILFSILTLLSLFFLFMSYSLGILLLFLLFLCLLIPYIFHYYYLENSVQYMYLQYDRLLEKKKK